MLADMSQKELEKMLLELIERLVKAGFMPNLTPEKKADIAKEVSKTLANDPDIVLSKEQLQKPEMMKSLGAACVMQANPSLNKKFDFMDLFRKTLKLTPEDNKLLEDALKLEKDHTPDGPIKKFTKVLANVLTPEKKIDLKKDLLIMQMLNAATAAAQNDPVAKQSLADYGVDTRFPGSVLKEFRGVCLGNQTARVDLALAGSKNQMGQLNDPNLGVPDPVGTKTANVLNGLAGGALTSKTELDLSRIIADAVGVSLTQAPTNTKK